MKEYVEKKWKHSDAKLIRTRAFDEIFNCSNTQNPIPEDIFRYVNSKDSITFPFLNFKPSDLTENTIYALAQRLNDGDEESLLNFFYENKDTIFKEFYSLQDKKKEGENIVNRAMHNNNNTGHLLVIIENISEKEISKLDFKFKEHIFPNVKFNDSIEKSNWVNRKTDNLKSGEKMIFLLNMYKPNDQLYPLEYYSSTWDLEYISYEVDGKMFEEKVREPFKSKANKEFLPFGWESQ